MVASRVAFGAALLSGGACAMPSSVAPTGDDDTTVLANATSTVTYSSEIPAGLWRASRDVRATPGNFVFVESSSAPSLIYTEDMSLTRVTRNDGSLTVSVSGADPLSGVFVGARGMRLLVMGFYEGASALPFRNPTAYGLFASVAECVSPSGWFVVDVVQYQLDAIVSLDLRFEARCDASGVVEHGQVHWRG